MTAIGERAGAPSSPRSRTRRAGIIPVLCGYPRGGAVLYGTDARRGLAEVAGLLSAAAAVASAEPSFRRAADIWARSFPNGLLGADVLEDGNQRAQMALRDDARPVRLRRSERVGACGVTSPDAPLGRDLLPMRSLRTMEGAFGIARVPAFADLLSGAKLRTVQRLSIDRTIATIAELLDEAGADVVTIVAVDGHSAAGKSTFAQRLAGRLGAAVVETDHFYRILDLHVRERLNARAGLDRYYDWPRLRQVLAAIRAQGTATFEPNDWKRNQLSDRSVTVGPTRCAVVEGLFAARPELSDLIDVAILVESPSSVRAARQCQRADASEEWLMRWDAVERLYLREVRTPDSFDFVVSDA